MFAIIDCNNFYPSCERLFRPDLHKKPIVVLSNNDGCVIARSNEAKALDIPMGAPFFKIRAIVNRYAVNVFSSNYPLYGDISHRVMSVIESSWEKVEIYSIDEAFLDLSQLKMTSIDTFCQFLHKKIFREIGIPTSIGIGPTKTLAKMANFIAKKILKIPVFNISQQDQWLTKIPIKEVWGVGRQWQTKLAQQGILTAADLAGMNPHFIRNRFNVVLMRTALELQGQSCLHLLESEPRKSIVSSKSFGNMQTSFSALSEAISSHCARACEKVRSQNLLAQRLCVFVHSNIFRIDLSQYSNSITCKLPHATNDTRLTTIMAKRCLKHLYKEGISYKKVGVMLLDLVSSEGTQFDFFSKISPLRIQKGNQLMKVMDAINFRYGHHTIKLAAEGYHHPWAMRAEMRSPCYTTRWEDIPQVRIGSGEPLL